MDKLCFHGNRVICAEMCFSTLPEHFFSHSGKVEQGFQAKLINEIYAFEYNMIIYIDEILLLN